MKDSPAITAMVCAAVLVLAGASCGEQSEAPDTTTPVQTKTATDEDQARQAVLDYFHALADRTTRKPART
jgi:hypothetical protein